MLIQNFMKFVVIKSCCKL